MPRTFDDKFLIDLCDIANRLKQDLLMNFTGQCESETMVRQTIRQAANRLADGEEPYSKRMPNVFVSSASQGVDNASGYRDMIHRGYFEEEQRGKDVLIFPTRKLLDDLLAYFESKEKRKRK